MIFATVLIFFIAPRGKDYYVSPAGNDNNPGTSRSQPWKSISKVNSSTILPGDTVHFQKGGEWRGQLIPHNGKNGRYVKYTSYGSGSKPLLLGSTDKSNAMDWEEGDDNIWRSKPYGKVKSKNLLLADKGSGNPGGWVIYQADNARVKAGSNLLKYGQGFEGIRIECIKNTNNAGDIQMFTTGIKIEKDKLYVLEFKAKCSEEFVLENIALMKESPPWTDYSKEHSNNSPQISAVWKDYLIYYKTNASDMNGRITFYLGKVLPKGAVFDLKNVGFYEASGDPLLTDIGNIIFDNGKGCGRKVWERQSLTNQNDFWYDRENSTLEMYSTSNPAEIYSSIECANTRNIVDISNKQYVILDGLDIRYGGAHGISGANTDHIIIRNCDISYIGGGDQSGNGKQGRYGNGVEFWDNASNNRVENCRIFEIYDAAVTNQGNGGKNIQTHIIYKNNKIWNCEYSFEYWNRPESSSTRNIYFENNVCLNAGGGWGHHQRPDPSGRHICFYDNTAQTENIVIRNNVFDRAEESCVNISANWYDKDELYFYKNRYKQPETNILVQWDHVTFYPRDFEVYQRHTGKDLNSRIN